MTSARPTTCISLILFLSNKTFFSFSLSLDVQIWIPVFFKTIFRLLDVVHSEMKLYLVFEYLNQDLKKYMDSCPSSGITSSLIKVSIERVKKGNKKKVDASLITRELYPLHINGNKYCTYWLGILIHRFCLSENKTCQSLKILVSCGEIIFWSAWLVKFTSFKT